MDSISKILIGSGVLLIGMGILWYYTDGKISLGKLPGDLRIETQNIKIFIPLTTGLIISVLLSLAAYFFKK